jgi:Icc-related predicted phosphoesterase
MAKFSWLQFSDLHFTGVNTVGTSDAREKMYELLHTEITECDYVFLTGDIAHKADYNGVEEQLKELAESINFHTEETDKSETFFWAVGNHDIKRVPEKTELIQGIRNSRDKKHEFDKTMVNEAKNLWLGWLGYNDYFRVIKELSPHSSHKCNFFVFANVVKIFIRG